MNEIITNLCGPMPESFIKKDILSDPNFVFSTDPNFTPVQLWDVDGNTVIVNSYEECSHYVDGGWGYNPLISHEQSMQSYLLIGFATVLMMLYLYRKIKK